MASIVHCINDLLAAGKITNEQADAIQRNYQRASDTFELSGYPRGQAQQMGAASALRSHRAGIAQRRRQQSLQLIAQSDAERDTLTHPRGRAAGLKALLDRDPDRAVTIESITARAGGLEALLHAKLADFLAQARTTALGLTQNTALLRDVVRERFGKATGNAQARAHSEAIGEAFEFTRQMFNRAGGAIAKLDGYGMPTAHESRLVADAAQLSRREAKLLTEAERYSRNKGAWLDFTVPLLDRDRMIGADLRPMSEPELRLLLDSTFDKIATDGLIDLVPGQRGGSKLANTRQEHRFLHFKDGDAWLAYHDRFGPSDIFATITSHLSGMAHEISLMEKFGPNPEGTYRYLRDLALRAGDLKEHSIDDKLIGSMWNVVSGKTGGGSSMAQGWTAARNWIAATRLGSGAVSALSDPAFIRQTAAWNALPASGVAKELMAQLAEMPAGERQIAAVKLGLGAEAWITRGLAANRFAEVSGLGLSAKAADFTMRASGLTKLTDAELKAWGMMVLGELGDRRALTFEQLHPDLRAGLSRFMDARAWDDLRGAPTMEPRPGAHYLSIENVLAHDALPEARRLSVARGLLNYIFETSRIAVPHPSATERAIATAGLSGDSIIGQVVRSVMQFKSFPLAIINAHVRRGIYEAGYANKARYLGGLIIGTTVMGALIVQLKDIAKGRDPREMVGDLKDAKFWGSALLQGGGAGIYGDFVYSGLFGQSRMGRGLYEEMAGPLVGTAGDVVKLTLGNIGQGLTGQDPHFVGEAIRFAGSNVPFLSSAWYARLGFERLVLDQLRLAADETSQRQMDRAVAQRQSEYNQGYWWRPGQVAPTRAPELNVVGE